MNEKEIFLILGIEPTREEEKIKAAYRNQLVKVNPEENAEGFKEVRRAYEEALCYAKESIKEEKLPETPIELWIERVKGIYESLSKRLDITNWEKLMKEDLCIDLDTSIEARDALLNYLKDNFRLKNEVWKLIDKIFLLREEEEELCEKFPKEFIQFVFQNCEKDKDFAPGPGGPHPLPDRGRVPGIQLHSSAAQGAGEGGNGACARHLPDRKSVV